MAQMKYEDYVKFNQKGTNGGPRGSSKPAVGYFGLKEDGDTAIVRFNISNLDDIRIVSKHTVKSKEGKIRSVGCLRSSPNDSLSVCPLCESGERVAWRAYVPLIHYKQSESGETEAVGALWEQAPRIRETLQSFTEDYGDLRDYLFKVVRHGKKGDPATTYTILPANPNIYKEDIFKKDFAMFESLNFERFVATKTAEDMHTFLEEGDFPFTSAIVKEVPVKETSRPAAVTNTYREVVKETREPEFGFSAAPTPRSEDPEEGAVRPRRVYTY